MKQYTVTLVEKVRYVVQIMAKSERDAIEMAKFGINDDNTTASEWLEATVVEVN